MFAVVGGFRAGLTRVGGFQCVGHCEIDKYAEASYRAIHDIREEERYYPDARAIDPDDLPQFDLLCGGFPCQAFSNAGRRKGFADARGTLFFEIARLAEAKRPRYLLLENVPGLLSHDHGKTFAAILSALDDLGYIQAIYRFPDKAAVVCNEEGKNLGLPFNRPLFDENDLPYDIICGTFFVAGLGVEDFVSLTEEQIRRYKEHYDRVMVLTAAKETTPQHKPTHPHKYRRGVER